MKSVKVSGFGAEPKKLAFLGVCIAIAAYFYFSSSSPSGSGKGSSSSSPSASVATTTSLSAPPVPLQKTPGRNISRNRNGQRGAGGSFLEFHPSLKPKKDVEIDRASIDPTLRMDLLEKLQTVKAEGGSRSLFEYSGSPATVAAAKIPEPKAIKISRPFTGPVQPAPVVAAAKPPEPPAPPILIKFYGFVSPKNPGNKRAVFLDGEDIIVATEGQLIKNRYKIVRIGVNSAVVEDTQFKNHQQTLPLVEEQQG